MDVGVISLYVVVYLCDCWYVWRNKNSSNRDIADAAVIDTVRQIEKLGEEQYDASVKERLVSQTKPISDPIKKNNLRFFSRPLVREKTKS